MPEPRVFTLVRKNDESGVSGPGRVLDGIIFHDGRVVVCWRGDVNSEDGCSSLGVYSSWEDFKSVHIDPHPTNRAQVVFGECELADNLQECGMDHPAAERRAEEKNASAED